MIWLYYSISTTLLTRQRALTLKTSTLFQTAGQLRGKRPAFWIVLNRIVKTNHRENEARTT